MLERYINNTKYSFDNFFGSNFGIYNLGINKYKIIIILWNLLLLFVPYFLCSILIKYWRKSKFRKFYQKILAIILGFIWLLFIPNTAYIITDVRHLLNYCPSDSPSRVCLDNAWMIIFFFVYASVGWVAYVYLVNQMKNFVIMISGRKIGSLFSWCIVPLISLGVLLGLINRWSSWEFFISPLKLLNNILDYFINFEYFVNWLVFTVFLYILYFGGNYIFRKRFIRKSIK